MFRCINGYPNASYGYISFKLRLQNLHFVAKEKVTAAERVFSVKSADADVCRLYHTIVPQAACTKAQLCNITAICSPMGSKQITKQEVV